MERLTFEKQICLGIAAVSLGHFLWFLTDIGYFVNLAFLLYGLLFLIHPVVPAKAQSHPRIRTWLRWVGAGFILLGCIMKNGGGEALWQNRVSNDLNIDAGGAVVQESMDTHGGFHGDGTTYVVLDFSQDPLTGCPIGEGWHTMPLTEDIQTLIYGIATEYGRQGPWLDVTIPQVKQGYWFFYDRYGKNFDDENVWTKGPLNYTFALYDAHSHILYFTKFDT